MWMQFIAEECWSYLEVTWICLILEKVLMRSMEQPRNKSQEAAIKKIMLFQETSGTEDRESRTFWPLLSVPSLVLMTRSVIHSLDQSGGIETSQKTEPKLDSGSENHTATTSKLPCTSFLSGSHKLIGLLGLGPSPPQPLLSPGLRAHLSQRSPSHDLLFFLHRIFHFHEILYLCIYIFITCPAD